MSTKFLKEIDSDKKIVFIIEDNEEYAKSLQIFIRDRFSEIKEIKRFTIGKMCLLELRNDPCIIIMDHFLNSEYEKVNNGIETIKRIKMLKPKTKIVVLSTKEKYDVITETIKDHNCCYVQKDQDTFKKIELLIKKNLDEQKKQVFMWN